MHRLCGHQRRERGEGGSAPEGETVVYVQVHHQQEAANGSSQRKKSEFEAGAVRGLVSATVASSS
jgi:hypothetical protein